MWRRVENVFAQYQCVWSRDNVKRWEVVTLWGWAAACCREEHAAQTQESRNATQQRTLNSTHSRYIQVTPPFLSHPLPYTLLIIKWMHYNITQHTQVHHSTTPMHGSTRHHAASTQHYAALRSTTQHYAAPRSTTQHHAAPRSITQHHAAHVHSIPEVCLHILLDH